MSIVGQGDDDPRKRNDDGPAIIWTDTEDGVLLYDEENPTAWIEAEGEQGVAYVVFE